MAILNPNDIVVGMTITFRTHNPRDTVKYIGKVTGICDYTLARTLADVDVYHQQVTHNQSVGDIKSLSFLVISYTDQDGGTTNTRCFAKEWINPSSLSLVSDKPYTDLRVYSLPQEKVSDIITLINSAGYSASVI